MHVSDSHLSPRAPFADAHWQAIIEYTAVSAPDLVVHTGDISLDGADRRDDLEHAREQLDRLPAPWLAIPGNHDIGDAAPSSQPVDETRRLRYSEVFGDASWAFDFDGWRLVGVDVQTLLSTLPAAGELWDWLDDALDRPAPTVLFVHRPLHPLAIGEADEPHRYVTEPARSRLGRLAAAGGVRLVASGHVHQWHHAEVAAASHVWAPSTWAALPDRVQPVIGAKLVGAVEHTLTPDGGVASELVQPPGVGQVVVGDDFASPYDHDT